ncbi:MAG: hypothetical protein HYT75_02150 [Deltaproteobacteria bacterium]|nr:hypothetical protein [Deltaproteobacteria bacterium]
MKNIHLKEKHLEELMHNKGHKTPSPLEIMRKTGGVAHPVKASQKGKPVDSMLAVYHDRLTYTFILDKEVASIHYDRAKGEIFFKGHNICDRELKEHEIKALKSLPEILMNDEQGKLFYNDYLATLSHALADNNKG